MYTRFFSLNICYLLIIFRLTTDSLKQLEADIEDLKANKEEICLESKNVIKNVRAWVNEQKKINAFVAKREREFMDSFKQLNNVKYVRYLTSKIVISFLIGF